MSYMFKDMKDRNWSMEVTADTVRRVRQHCDVDLMDIGGENFLTTIMSDEIAMVNMFFIIVEDQAKASNITDIDFGKAMAGDCIEDASQAFLEGLTSFFRPSKREAAKKLLAKTNQVAEAVFQKTGLEIDQINPDSEAEAYIESIKATTK